MYKQKNKITLKNESWRIDTFSTGFFGKNKLVLAVGKGVKELFIEMPLTKRQYQTLSNPHNREKDMKECKQCGKVNSDPNAKFCTKKCRVAWQRSPEVQRGFDAYIKRSERIFNNMGLSSSALDKESVGG